jgi:hypothetical protein
MKGNTLTFHDKKSLAAISDTVGQAAFTAVFFMNRFMKTNIIKKALSFIAAAFILTATNHAQAAITVTNGDFNDITGLTYVGDVWYNGIPSGWNTDFPNTFYTVKYTGITNGAYNYVANLSQLTVTSPFAALWQSVGTTDYTGDVTLKFDLSELTPSGTNWEVGAAIFQGPNFGTLLALGQIKNGSLYTDPGTGVVPNGLGTFEITAPSVASGSLLQIAFWTTGGTPGLDNVSIIPEPTTLDLISLPVTAGAYMVDMISKNIYTCGINPRKFNALTIVY